MTRLWKSALRVQVINRVKSRGSDWQAVEVFRRGWSDSAEKCEATVVITVKKGTEVSGWTATVHEISDLCTEVCAEPVQAELLVASVVRQFRPISEKMDWIGGSLGLEGSPDFGTLGGYLNLRRDGEVLPVAMTCHHVFSSDPARKRPRFWDKVHCVCFELNPRSYHPNKLGTATSWCFPTQRQAAYGLGK